MKTSEVLENLKGAISHAKQVGVEYVAMADLEFFAEELKRQASESPEGVTAGEASMEAYKAKLAALGNSLQQEHETGLEMLRTVITTGQSALKSALLINGGAAAALLAFVGGIWGKPEAKAALPNIAYGLSLFVWGVLSAACASGATYLSQAGFNGELGKRSQAVGEIARGLAIACVIAAYVLFACGAWQAYVAVSS